MSDSSANTSAQLVSIAAAADFLGVDTKTVRRYISRGALTAYRLGDTRLIRVDLNQITSDLLRPIPAGGVVDA